MPRQGFCFYQDLSKMQPWYEEFRVDSLLRQDIIYRFYSADTYCGVLWKPEPELARNKNSEMDWDEKTLNSMDSARNKSNCLLCYGFVLQIPNLQSRNYVAKWISARTLEIQQYNCQQKTRRIDLCEQIALSIVWRSQSVQRPAWYVKLKPSWQMFLQVTQITFTVLPAPTLVNVFPLKPHFYNQQLPALSAWSKTIACIWKETGFAKNGEETQTICHEKTVSRPSPTTWKRPGVNSFTSPRSVYSHTDQKLREQFLSMQNPLNAD